MGDYPDVEDAGSNESVQDLMETYSISRIVAIAMRVKQCLYNCAMLVVRGVERSLRQPFVESIFEPDF